ncbi:hypothetical protein HAX54_029312 [Datura stramonium]|uniref:Uncharacterized protein n=1 Tax=Datura stramonium TaxID=4076 RepID=A0ABS8V8I5_DATST|nr:hypothetical protein [Datura stramonium]
MGANSLIIQKFSTSKSSRGPLEHHIMPTQQTSFSICLKQSVVHPAECMSYNSTEQENMCTNELSLIPLMQRQILEKAMVGHLKTLASTLRISFDPDLIPTTIILVAYSEVQTTTTTPQSQASYGWLYKSKLPMSLPLKPVSDSEVQSILVFTFFCNFQIRGWDRERLRERSFDCFYMGLDHKSFLYLNWKNYHIRVRSSSLLSHYDMTSK